LKIDPERIAVAGDDAGGNIAAALALIARDRNVPEIAAQVLIGPMLDPSMTKLGDAKRLGSDLKPETCADCYSKYLPRAQERLHPYASPLESRRLRGLPPALVLTAECDVLHKEGEQYAAALINAGVPTQVTRFNVRHAELHEHTPLLEEAADFLRRQLHTN
jgi:acetyl esterase/lipase